MTVREATKKEGVRENELSAVRERALRFRRGARKLRRERYACTVKAVKRIDREVERKLEEFGRLENGALTVPFLAPDLDMVKEWLQ